MSEVGLTSIQSLPDELMPKANISVNTTRIAANVANGFLRIISRKARTIGIIAEGTIRSLKLVA